MNRFVRLKTSIASMLAASTLLVAGATGAPLVMTIDQNASSLTLNGQLSVFALLEQAPGSKTTSYTGSITVDVDDFHRR